MNREDFDKFYDEPGPNDEVIEEFGTGATYEEDIVNYIVANSDDEGVPDSDFDLVISDA